MGGRAAREPELAADLGALLDQGHGRPRLRRLERRGDARRAAADHEHVARRAGRARGSVRSRPVRGLTTQPIGTPAW